MGDFYENDLKQLSRIGIPREKVLDQVATFREGIPFVNLEKAALVSSGIVKLNPEDEGEMELLFTAAKNELNLLKFIPASGAASRMFKTLFNFLETYHPGSESIASYLERTGNRELATFFERQRELPFFEIINHRIRGQATSKDEERNLFVKEMLLKEGCDYGFYPKGLLPFHNYGDFVATPFEEHLKEAADYASVQKEAYLHFTISEQHGELFNKEFNTIRERVSNATKTSFHITYSYQKSSTDTIAVTPDDKPFRNDDGTLFFRPGGHGALIENLNEQDADIIFIKNIDNVAVPELAKKMGHSKKVLAGFLLKIQRKAFEYAALLEEETISGEQLNEITSFLEGQLNVRLSDNFSGFTLTQQLEILKDKVNRPIRICGMVENVGEPGGGPFWIRDSKGHISLQIIEAAQVDPSNAGQQAILRNATHFNPVDLVCGVRNYKGEKFNLLNYVDKKQGFITKKTSDGKSLKALELPGLWNGAMAFWNTIFVEVPLFTFNPVKTVNDLLKPAHQV